jgi:two-component system chemotaxis response regulator CheY
MAKRILIVDANETVAGNLKQRLSSLGEVQLVHTAAALQTALAFNWDLVVSTAELPELDKYQLLERLEPRRRPVFIYSADSAVAEAPEWAELGVKAAFSHLQRSALIAAAEQLLVERSATQEPAFLLVEDSPTVRQFVKAVLRQTFPHAEIFEAEDGRTALAVMKSSRVSLIVTDLQMPGMDGMSFVQLLRNNAVLKRKPVVVFSGAVTAELHGSLSRLEKVQVLSKPATPEQLLDAVHSLLA